jgi:hypothetical protein
MRSARTAVRPIGTSRSLRVQRKSPSAARFPPAVKRRSASPRPSQVGGWLKAEAALLFGIANQERYGVQPVYNDYRRLLEKLVQVCGMADYRDLLRVFGLRTADR